MGKSVAYFTKWANFLPILRNGQFRGLGVTYICYVQVEILYRYLYSEYIKSTGLIFMNDKFTVNYTS